MDRLEGRVRDYVREVEVKRLALLEPPRQWAQEEAGEMVESMPGQGLGAIGQGLGSGGGSSHPLLTLGVSESVAEGGDVMEYGASDQRGGGGTSTGRYTAAPGPGLGQGTGLGQSQGAGRALAVSFNVDDQNDGNSDYTTHQSLAPTPGLAPASGPGLTPGAGATEQTQSLDPELLENIVLQESVIDQLGVETLEAFVTQVINP